jgi:hypothetical protein
VKTAHLVCRFWCLAIIDVGGCCSVSEGEGKAGKSSSSRLTCLGSLRRVDWWVGGGGRRIFA